MKKNNYLRIKIAQMVQNAGEGHIPSAYSIIDILETLYDKVLKFNPKKPDCEDRDYLILSKGHGCAALYVVLEKYGFITETDLNKAGQEGARLGGHPDCTKVPGAEASTGSLGHGLVTAMGIALGIKIQKKKNKVFAIIGDGESNEGTTWETALIAQNLCLGNLCFIIDRNQSIDEILKYPNMGNIWKSFNWDVYEVDGHDEDALLSTINSMSFSSEGKPKVIIAHTTKGKGVGFIEGHGQWHHRIPTDEDMIKLKAELA